MADSKMPVLPRYLTKRGRISRKAPDVPDVCGKAPALNPRGVTVGTYCPLLHCRDLLFSRTIEQLVSRCHCPAVVSDPPHLAVYLWTDSTAAFRDIRSADWSV